jgi:hypothetical protein
VTSAAESHQLGADIAIVHPGTARILLYQAKLAILRGGALRLKSDVTYEQIRLLNRQEVEVEGRTHEVIGRLAIYQADDTPFIRRCPPHSNERPSPLRSDIAQWR